MQMPPELEQPSTSIHAEPSRTRLRRWRRRVVLGLVAVLLLGGGSYVWLGATSQVRATGGPCASAPLTGMPGPSPGAARDGICSTMDALTSAWNAGDAAAYGARFTENATYVTFVGTVYQGRAEIAAGHAALFSGLLEGSRLEGGGVLSMDFLAPDVARVVTRGDDKVQSYLMVERAGAWQVAAFHNTERAPAMERFQFLLDPASVPREER